MPPGHISGGIFFLIWLNKDNCHQNASKGCTETTNTVENASKGYAASKNLLLCTLSNIFFKANHKRRSH